MRYGVLFYRHIDCTINAEGNNVFRNYFKRHFFSGKKHTKTINPFMFKFFEMRDTLYLETITACYTLLYIMYTKLDVCVVISL